MAFEQYFVQGWESIPTATKESEKASPCFDCSICLDFACDPVVTLCGHLYCWPCIYKWFNTPLASDEVHKCPVCKTEISQKTVVPLYGRGQSLSETEGKVIPPRPQALTGLTNLFNPEHQQLGSHGPYENPNNLDYSSPALFDQGDSATMGSLHPSVGMFGEMVYARVFGNSQSLFTYPSSYHTVVSSSPRMRRGHQQAHESLSRVTIFLFCFCILCLLVF